MGKFSDQAGRRRGKKASELTEDDAPPFQFTEDKTITDLERTSYKCDEVWVSGRYTVFVRRGWETGWSRKCECCEVEGEGPHPNCDQCEGSGHRPMVVTHLSIKRNDRESIHDWRDFQIIKNVFCGEGSEGIEIYPAEDRLVDTSNQYHLWVFPEGERIPVGFNDGRLVTSGGFGKAKQRPFEQVPDDAVGEEDFFRMAITFCESKGLYGERAEQILGRLPTPQEVRAVYEPMTDADLESLLIRFRLSHSKSDAETQRHLDERMTIITSLQAERNK